MFLPRFLCLALMLPHIGAGQPRIDGNQVLFSFRGEADSSVSVVGDFNGWSSTSDPMSMDRTGMWTARRLVTPGLYQYKFLVDGSRYVMDSGNPASVENHDGSSRNSSFVVTEEGEIRLTSTFSPTTNPDDVYEPAPDRKPVYLNIIWHQHQPLYVDPETDQLKGPWVRTHATKDYYDMAAMLLEYPSLHCTINLTSSLLMQLQRYYVDRLSPFVDPDKNVMDVDAFLAKWKGKTDPWIDLALTPTEDFSEAEQKSIHGNVWNAFGISEVMIHRFPAYAALKERAEKGPLTIDEMRETKLWFYLAYFDPDFLRGAVSLPDGTVCDLSDLIRETKDGRFHLKRSVTEEDCRRMVVESWKIMSNIVRLHRTMLLTPEQPDGQIEVITTPYYHPILPLVYDSDLARVSQPESILPSRFSFPEDAAAQVRKAVRFYRELFGRAPEGMWPGEGAVAQPILALLYKNGIQWTASDEKVLGRSRPANQANTTPYRFPSGGNEGGESSVAIVFRDTELSDRIGFRYQTYDPEVAAEDFVQSILARQPQHGENDLLLTVILDGENAWEWYRKDIDGKGFLNALYRKLTKLHELGRVITTTTSEYIRGNATRGIAPHPVSELASMEWLHPGSWINSNFDTWIGEKEENLAWEALLQTRNDLAMSGVHPPDPDEDPPAEGTHEWYSFMAWEALYAAEGSDWFWWYGSDQYAPAGDKPFDDAFLTHLNNVYKFVRLAGGSMPERHFAPIIAEEQHPGSQGTMAMSRHVKILFTCDVSAESVESSVFIAGNLNNLGWWTPNVVRMFDDGTHGDEKAGDRIWSLAVDVPAGTEILYKYSNSGTRGEWAPGDELPGENRSFFVPAGAEGTIVLSDIFGRKSPE